MLVLAYFHLDDRILAQLSLWSQNDNQKCWVAFASTETERPMLHSLVWLISKSTASLGWDFGKESGMTFAQDLSFSLLKQTQPMYNILRFPFWLLNLRERRKGVPMDQIFLFGMTFVRNIWCMGKFTFFYSIRSHRNDIVIFVPKYTIFHYKKLLKKSKWNECPKMPLFKPSCLP